MNRSSRILSVGIVPTLLASVAPAADPATAEAWPSTLVHRTPDPGVFSTIVASALVAVVVGLVLFWAGRHRDRDGTPRCRRCLHDLSGSEELPARCHECGAAVGGRVVRSSRSIESIARRRLLGRAGLGVAILGGVVLLPAAYLHPIRYGLVPTAWLTHVDAAWALRLPTFRSGDLTLVPKFADPFHVELWERGRRGLVSDATTVDLAELLLEGDRGSRRMADTEIQLILSTAFALGLPFEDLVDTSIARPWLQQDQMSSPRILHGERSRIAIREGLVGRMGRLAGAPRGRSGPFDIRIRILRGTVGDVAIANDRTGRLLRSRSPGHGVQGIGLELLPAPGETFEPGVHDVEYDVEVEVTWNAAPEGPRFLGRRVFSRAPAQAVTIRIPPPHLGGEEACNEIGRFLSESSTFELDAAGTSGRLVLRLPGHHALELGTPVVKVGCDIIDSPIESIEVGPHWPSHRGRTRLAVLDDSSLEEDGSILLILDVEAPDGSESARIGGESVRVRIDSTTLDERAWWDMVDFEDHDGELDRLLSCTWFFEVPIHQGEAP